MSGNHHLRDAHTVFNRKRLLSEVYHQHAKLSAIIRVNRPHAIHHSDAVFDAEPATRPNLCLIAPRNRDRKSRRNEPPLHRLKRHRLIQTRIHVRPGRTCRLVLRQQCVSMNPCYLNVHIKLDLSPIFSYAYIDS